MFRFQSIRTNRISINLDEWRVCGRWGPISGTHHQIICGGLDLVNWIWPWPMDTLISKQLNGSTQIIQHNGRPLATTEKHLNPGGMIWNRDLSGSSGQLKTNLVELKYVYSSTINSKGHAFYFWSWDHQQQQQLPSNGQPVVAVPTGAVIGIRPNRMMMWCI